MKSLKKTIIAITCGVGLTCVSPLAIAATSGPALIAEKNISWKIPYKPLDFVQSVDGKTLYVLTENNRVLIYETSGKLKGSLQVDAGVTAIDTDARGENILLIDSEKNTFTSIAVDFIVDIDTTGSPFMGSANAPVTIAVFTDFE